MSFKAEEGYEAEVEYLAVDEWAQELDILLKEAINDKGEIKTLFMNGEGGPSPQVIAISACSLFVSMISMKAVWRSEIQSFRRSGTMGLRRRWYLCL